MVQILDEPQFGLKPLNISILWFFALFVFTTIHAGAGAGGGKKDTFQWGETNR